jgi:NAD(P)H-dependent flavin oxidoreductase YrpB (nitropropane dioxygenase family)
LEKNATVTLRTRLTEKLNITHPVLLAPMGSVSGGRLAGAVSEAGGLGLIGGGYGDRDWLEGEFAAAGNRRVGCGFITWSLAKEPGLLDVALARRPAALMLSFGDPRPFAKRRPKASCSCARCRAAITRCKRSMLAPRSLSRRAPRPAATAAPAPRCRWCRRSSIWWRGARPRW